MKLALRPGPGGRAAYGSVVVADLEDAVSLRTRRPGGRAGVVDPEPLAVRNVLGDVVAPLPLVVRLHDDAVAGVGPDRDLQQLVPVARQLDPDRMAGHAGGGVWDGDEVPSLVEMNLHRRVTLGLGRRTPVDGGLQVEHDALTHIEREVRALARHVGLAVPLRITA